MSVHDGSRGFFAGLVRRPILLGTLLTTSIVIGLIAWARIPIQMMPDGIVEPGLEVFVVNLGASAQENEEKVARVVEEELRSLPAVKNIESTSRSDNVGVFVEFEGSTDMNFAKAEVRDRIERARPKLPATVQEIGIFSWSESDLPIMFVALRHPGDSARTDFLVDNVIKRRLDSVDGVGKVDVWGVLDDSMRILIDEDKARAARLDLGALIRRLSADNFSLSLGEVQDGGTRILVRSDMRFRSPEEIEAYPIGGGLRIGDVAHVEAVKSVRESLFRIDGQYAYFVEIRKDSQANVVATCHRLKAELDALAKDPALAGEFSFVPIFDQGEFIESSLKQLTDTAWEGGVLAVGILFVFLWRVRQTLLVALSIPVSVVMAIAWCFFTGRSFNVLTMTGITLAMGMLVDNAIVVIENIARLKQEGADARTAVVQGTSEVALAVLLSTLTTVVVFLPMIFMTENPVLRLMFGELGLPLCVSLLISLVVALVFMPVACVKALGPRPALLERVAASTSRVGSLPARALAWIVGGVRAALYGTMRVARSSLAIVLRAVVPLRWVLALGVVALAAWRLYEARTWMSAVSAVAGAQSPDSAIATRWIVAVCSSAATALVVLLWRAPVARRALAGRMARPASFVPAGRSVVGLVVDANQALVRWTLEHRFAATLVAALCFFSVFVPGTRMKVAAFGEDDSRTQTRVYVELEDNFTLAQASDEMARYEGFLETKRAAYGFQRLGVRFTRLGGSLRLFWDNAQTEARMQFVKTDLKENLPRFSGHRLRFLDDMQAGDSRNRNVVTFAITGPDSEVLARFGEEALRLLERVPGLDSIDSPLENAPHQVNVALDSDLAQKMGVTPRDALENVAWALRGFQLPRYQEQGREVPLIVEYDGTEVAGLNTLRELEVTTQSNAVPLSSFAHLEFGRGSRAIWRKNGQATFRIQARVENPARQKELSDAGYAALAALDLPRGYALGEEDSIGARQEQEMGELKNAGLLSLALVFLLMGILFESFVLPVSVLFTIPFAVVGAYWVLYLTGTALDSVGWIGIIILIGVVVNNGIVLVDRVHSLRAQGWERSAAVVEGCANRVRPILMTALTSVTGLLPMAMSEPPGGGIDFRALATCVGGGLLVSTIFTLWVVPLAYTMIDDAAAAIARQVRWCLASSRARKAAREAAVDALPRAWASDAPTTTSP